MTERLTEPAKLLLLSALLAKDHIITNNGKAFLKEVILRRDPRLGSLLSNFEATEAGDPSFLDKIHDLIEDEAFTIYNDIFVETSLDVGKTLSKDERDLKNLNNEKSLIYGEVDFHSFYKVLRKVNLPPGGTFYDLGSGTGKAVFAARLVCDFDRCVGVEILEGLHNQGQAIVKRFMQSFQGMLHAGQNQMASVHQGSFLDYDWSDGDLVFANSTCFDDELMANMSAMAAEMKPGSIFVTFTKGLTSDAFEVLERKRYKMSWGPATVFIHRRLGYDGNSATPAYKLNILPSDSVSYDDVDTKNIDYVSDDDDDEEEEEEEEGSDYNGDEDDYERGKGKRQQARDDEEEESDEDYNQYHYSARNASQYGPEQDQYGEEEEERVTSFMRQQMNMPMKQPLRLNISKTAKASPSGTGSLGGMGSPQDAALLKRKRLAAGR